MIKKNIRILARLDIKNNNVIKSIQMEGLRVVGVPHELSLNYYKNGIDGLLYIDSVASLYGRNHMPELLEKVVEDCFIPITVGGGIRSITDIETLLDNGADKVAINSYAITNPFFLHEATKNFGSQAIVLSIEARRQPDGSYGVYFNNGRELSSINLVEWVKKAESLGVGEILLTSIDREGMRKGFDVDLLKEVSSAVSIPVIASGGFGKPEHALDAVIEGGASALAIADALHYNRFHIDQIKSGFPETISIRHVS